MYVHKFEVSTVLNDTQEASATIVIRSNALDAVVNALRTATSSMTSVLKPVKFFASIKTFFTAKELWSPDLDVDSLQFRAFLVKIVMCRHEHLVANLDLQIQTFC